jgi:hypothetical protein
MKKVFKLFGLIALVAVIGFSMAACDTGGDDDGGTGGTGGTTNFSLDDIWVNGEHRVEIIGSTGYLRALPSDMGALWNDARNKGYVKIGDPYWRNLTSTGNLTWSGQMLAVTWSGSNNNASGTTWNNVTITMSSDGQTINDGSNFKRMRNLSLNGVWENGEHRVEIIGNTGYLRALPSDMGALWNDARNKGYVKIGDPYWRNLTSTGNLTWSGQMLAVTWSGSNNNASGTTWNNVTITMSSDGQTINDGSNFIRK